MGFSWSLTLASSNGRLPSGLPSLCFPMLSSELLSIYPTFVLHADHFWHYSRVPGSCWFWHSFEYPQVVRSYSPSCEESLMKAQHRFIGSTWVLNLFLGPASSCWLRYTFRVQPSRHEWSFTNGEDSKVNVAASFALVLWPGAWLLVLSARLISRACFGLSTSQHLDYFCHFLSFSYFSPCFADLTSWLE